MNTGIDMKSAAERSAAYRTLAEAFTYTRAGTGPFGISGADYNDAFDPSLSPQACSLRERAHAQEDQSSIFEELMRFYEFFGLKRDTNAEMPDHLGVELESMHFLTHLEDKVADQPLDLASVRRAQHDFLTRHLARLVRGVHTKLKTSNRQCSELVETTLDFINAEIKLGTQYAQA